MGIFQRSPDLLRKVEAPSERSTHSYRGIPGKKPDGSDLLDQGAVFQKHAA